MIGKIGEGWYSQNMHSKVDLRDQRRAFYRLILKRLVYKRFIRKMRCYCKCNKYEEYLINSQSFTKNQCVCEQRVSAKVALLYHHRAQLILFV